jgi:hypothetical protein
MGAWLGLGSMCICVDCHWVDRCQAYHAVERHLCSSPDFLPQQPRIHVQVQDLAAGGVGVEWDVRACRSFQRDGGRWLRLCPGAALPP